MISGYDEAARLLDGKNKRTALKVQLFDEIVNNMDNDDTILLNKGRIYSHGQQFYTNIEEGKEVSFDTIEEALRELGYNI